MCRLLKICVLASLVGLSSCLSVSAQDIGTQASTEAELQNSNQNLAQLKQNNDRLLQIFNSLDSNSVTANQQLEISNQKINELENLQKEQEKQIQTLKQQLATAQDLSAKEESSVKTTQSLLTSAQATIKKLQAQKRIKVGIGYGEGKIREEIAYQPLDSRFQLGFITSHGTDNEIMILYNLV